MPRNKMINDIVLSDSSKPGQIVNIRVLNGPYDGKEFEAKEVEETHSGQIVKCYHVHNGAIKTYFLGKDVIIL